ncbi:unnamed protein product [Effrenium voratum]|uniref:RRM domain-containing protein n=1 Tax=Effrenium voratum TaxID=2562239 RepID=A0AA36NKZ6_9DINO|nr:unnamed protein product [Effrenium voratum]CAJ1406493.1 unnamed protein product [Effrenium voratum]
MAVRDTIEIIDGVHSGTTRLSLKTQLERFGEIDICHKIGDPREDTPWVRFRDSKGALSALDAIARGEVLIDGVPIKAQWRARRKEPPGFKSGARTSRDIYLEQQQARGRRDRSGSGDSRRNRGDRRSERRERRSRDRRSRDRSRRR